MRVQTGDLFGCEVPVAVEGLGTIRRMPLRQLAVDDAGAALFCDRCNHYVKGKTMNDYVWISRAPSDSTLSDGFMKTDVDAESNDAILALARVAQAGGTIDPAQFPTEAWGEMGDYRSHHFPGAWPDLFYYAGFWILSARSAAILRQFDLGSGHILPLRLFERDHATPVLGEWFIWNIGNLKQALSPEQSRNLIKVGESKWMSIQLGDRDVKCTAKALEGADVWFDPGLHDMLFLSGPLGDKLRAEGLATEKAGFGELIKCDVIEG